MVIHKSRFESFSDGVISVSLTLMLYQIHLPTDYSWQGLGREAHNLFGYVLSFVYVGIYWSNHHHLFLLVRGINGRIMWFNLNLLFWLTMVPITTTWVSESGLMPVPTAVYAAVLFMCALSYWVLVRVLVASEGQDSELARTMGRDLKGAISMPVYAAAVAASFFSVTAAFLILTAMAALWFVPDSRIERYLARQGGGPD